MAATPEQVARLRALVNEPTTDTYTDEQIAAVIERYPLVDARGEEPFVWSSTSSPLAPPVQDVNPVWIEGYDMMAAAAEIWSDKAAIVAQDYDFDAPRDDGAYQRSQVYKQYMGQARYYLSRRNMSSLRVLGAPRPVPSIVANWNDPFA